MPENELLKALRNIQNPPKPKPAQKPGSTGVPAIDKQVAIRAERERKQLAKVEKTNTVTYRRQVGTSPIKVRPNPANIGEARTRTAEAEMADYDRRVFGIVTSGDFNQLTPEVIKRLGGVKRAKQMFAERNNYRDTKAIPMIAEINRRNEAYTSGGLTQEELDQSFATNAPTALETMLGAVGSSGVPGIASAAYRAATGQQGPRERAPITRFLAEGQPGIATDNDAQLFGRAVSTVLNQPVSVTRAGLTGDARQTRELGAVGAVEELGNFGAGMMAGGSLGTIGTGTKVAQAAKLLSRALVTDAPGYAVMIKDSGGIGQAVKSMAESVGYGFSKDASPADTVNSVAMTLALLGGAYHMGGKTLTGAKNALKARLPKEVHPKIEAAAKVVEAPVNEQEAMMRELLGEDGPKEFARAKIERQPVRSNLQDSVNKALAAAPPRVPTSETKSPSLVALARTRQEGEARLSEIPLQKTRALLVEAKQTLADLSATVDKSARRAAKREARASGETVQRFSEQKRLRDNLERDIAKMESLLSRGEALPEHTAQVRESIRAASQAILDEPIGVVVKSTKQANVTRTATDVTADIKESLSTLKDLKKSGKLLKDPTRKGGKQSGGLYIPQLTPEGRAQVIHLAGLVLERTKMAKDEFVDKFSVMIGNTGPRDFVRGVASEAYDAVTAKPASTVAPEPKTPQKPVQAPQTAKASVVNPPEPSDGKPVFQSAQDPSDRLRSELGWAPVSRGGRPLADVLASPVVKDIAERGGEFAREWQDSPRALTAEETAGLGAAVIDTRIALRNAEIEHQAMTTAGKMYKAADIAEQIDKLSEDLANLTYVVSKSGSEWGMAGLARQMELRRGNDRSGLQYRLRRAKRGQKPSASEVRVAEQIGKKFEDIESEIQRRVDKIIADRFDLPRRVGRTNGARFPGVKKTVFTDEMFKAAITKGCK